MKRLRSFSRRRRENYYWLRALAIHSLGSRFSAPAPQEKKKHRLPPCRYLLSLLYPHLYEKHKPVGRWCYGEFLT